MARYFKKRKTAGGPNKNEQKVMRGEDSRRGGSGEMMGPRFPFVKEINLRLTFLNAQQRVLEEKTVSFGPMDSCEFTVPCPGRCGRGSFDFTLSIERAVSSRNPQLESSGKCLESLYADSVEKCGCELKYAAVISYLPLPTVPQPS